MRGLSLLFCLFCALWAQLYAATLIHASEHGLLPGTQDAGPALRELLHHAPAHSTIELPAGEYHFYAEGAPAHQLFISNHDQQPEHPVALPLIDKEGLTLRGRGVSFVFHGRILPVLVMNSRHTTLQGISLRYATPLSAEGRLVEVDAQSTTLEMHADSRWCVEEGRFFNRGEGWKSQAKVAIAFLPDGRMLPSGRSGDIIWNAPAEQLSPTRVRFRLDARRLGLETGHTLVLRSHWRPNPAIFILNSQDTKLEEIVIHDSMGMGVLGQRSEDITLRGGGVIRRAGHYGTTGADATHFSNCRGHISISHALFEGMMDDAINVHATCLALTELISPTEVVARYMHPQAVGLELLRPGEQLRFIHARTLENNPQLVCVASATLRDARTLHLLLESPLPAGISVGDALENADWHPSVSFCHNTVRHNRARGALFTTSEPVLVEHNHFDWSSGSAILLAGDACGWYESGACRDVCIRHNTFEHCLTSLFQFTDAIIAICPEVKQPELQRERYHRNIRIEHNRFLTHRVPLLSAISAEGLSFRHNEVIHDDVAPTLFGGKPFSLNYCEQTELQLIPEALPAGE